MLTALWTGLGGRLAERWDSSAVMFWTGGVLAWVWGHGGLSGPGSGWQAFGSAWEQEFGGLPVAAQVVIAVLALLIVAGSRRLAEALTPGVLRLLEGYWPAWASPVRAMLIGVRGRGIGRRADRWRALARRRAELSAAERAEYAALNAWRATVPPAPPDRMPTGLGDLLRAVESRPRHRYGLDAVVCWPRLWLVLPEEVRAEVAAARARLDANARLWLWSLLFGVWTVFTWWALAAALVGTAVGYRLALSAAAQYGQLVQACFDLHRGGLYEALGRELPSDPRREYEAGRELTARLERGRTPPAPGEPA
ncbi:MULTISPECIES: hypothetical protein [Streptomyces]|uniref:Uncharacterized protein n=1 Tax=Streptomyces pini TaxID=1520580 RepID=A0A1I4DYM1_9ACTN|nr:hypothetical protein [Streptomyces pini]SFK98545.1 hypothetical protein SAMN05192584_11172 [Streptomyces pini]